MHVIGTAGHVDHGKSTLVQALTGINPDRLKEEQEREMTIDLGFAWLTLPDGESVSVVDVPGHEDFIRNMLAGIGGIDAALLVIAADEGVMPQTREHVAILDLLRVQTGVVALTKADLAPDPEWLDLVKADVTAFLAGTSLAEAKIVPVSARTGQGLPDLLNELSRLLHSGPARRDLGRPRLPIDRVFTIAGFGTVVTGTLVDGRFRVGDEVDILPGDLHARIRGLQSHKTKIETARPGSRVAVNLTGVSTDQLMRGQVLAYPGSLAPTLMVDARLNVLTGVAGPLRHNAQFEFFSGAARVMARARVLGAPEIPPGEAGWVQFCFDEPIALLKNDRFILRQLSPSATIGGGVIVDPHPARRHARFRPAILRQLETLAHGSPEEVLLEALQHCEPAEARAMVRQSNLAQAAAEEALGRLLSGGMVVIVDGNGAAVDAHALVESNRRLMLRASWEVLLDRAVEAVGEYHRQYPLRTGMPREEVKTRLHLEPRLFDRLMAEAVQARRVVEAESVLHLPEHRVKFSESQQAAASRLMSAFNRNLYTPPTLKEAEAEVGAEVLAALIEQGRIVKVSSEICFAKRAYEEMKARMVAHMKTQGALSVQDVRDMFGTSRKYIVPFLEHLDTIRVTRRVGDDRVLR